MASRLLYYWVWCLIVSIPDLCSLSYFVSVITGPVAMNWFVVIGDEYAAQRMLNFGVLNACPGFITESKSLMTFVLFKWDQRRKVLIQ